MKSKTPTTKKVRQVEVEEDTPESGDEADDEKEPEDDDDEELAAQSIHVDFVSTSQPTDFV